MNEERRKKLEAVNRLLDQCKSDLEEIQGDEQEMFDNMPENLQQGDKGQKVEEAIDCLQQAIDGVGDSISQIETAIS